MKPLRLQLKDKKDEILRVTADKGQFEGMRFAGVKSYIPFTRWLKEVTGSEKFGVCPTNPDSLRSDSWASHQAWMDSHKKRLSLLETKISLEREIAEVEQDIRLWEWKILEAKRTPVELSEVM